MLAHSLVTSGGAPARWLLFLHGIFGSGANWRTFARRWCALRPAWGAVLVDLRKHGGSQDLPPPHTLLACADDLAALAGALPGPVRGVLGHSFGGKVALAYASRAPGLEHLFIIDSAPGARPEPQGPGTPRHVLSLLSSLEREFPSREAFVERLVQAGLSREMAQWLAMNLRREDGRQVLAMDLPALGELLADYYARDLWSVVESPPAGTTLHLVAGGRSEVFGPAERQRALAAAAHHPGRVRFDVLPEAGHFVHVDQPERLLGLLADRTQDRGTS